MSNPLLIHAAPTTNRQFDGNEDGDWDGPKTDEHKELPFRKEDAMYTCSWNINHTDTKSKGQRGERYKNDTGNETSCQRIFDSPWQWLDQDLISRCGDHSRQNGEKQVRSKRERAAEFRDSYPADIGYARNSAERAATKNISAVRTGRIYVGSGITILLRVSALSRVLFVGERRKLRGPVTTCFRKQSPGRG